MPDAPRGIPVRIDGLLRGTDLSGEGSVAGRGDALELLTPAGPVVLPFVALEGVQSASGELDLFVVTGDVLRLAGPERLADLAQALVRRACVVPEVTLSLRGLGSRRGTPGSDHDRFYAPLLLARRRAERAPGPEAIRRALDAGELSAAVQEVLRTVATERHPTRAPERRALEARVFECAERLLAALERLAAAERVLDESDPSVRFVRWREWSAAVRAVFERADDCWLDVCPMLGPVERPRRGWRRWLRLGAAALVVLPAAARAQHVTVRVRGLEADSLRARGFDVVGRSSPGAGGDLLVVADSAERDRLRAAGAEIVAPVFAPGTGLRRQQLLAESAATTVYRPFDDPARGVAFFLDSLARANPLVHLDTIGRSVEGRPMLVVKIGEPDDSPGRPNVLFLATYHAREWAATEMALRLIGYLARSPAADARVDSLVRRRDIWVLPVANPDGYQYSFTTDRLWRKNRRPNADGSVGVDLNRNHDQSWGLDDTGSSPLPRSELYRGPAPNSEPEVQAIVAFHAAHPPIASVSYHSYAGLVLYPWGNTFGVLPTDLGIFRALAGTDVHPSVLDHLPGSPRDHYHPAPAWNLYTTNGEYTDWAYAAHHTIAFTVELTSGFEGSAYYGFELPDDEGRLQTLFADNLPFALDLLDAAADPLHARPLGTGLASEPVAVESVAPGLRARVPLPDVAGAAFTAEGLPFGAVPDSAGAAAYTQRLIVTYRGRPTRVEVAAGSRTSAFQLLAANGAELGESGWTASGDFTRDAPGVAGASAWVGGRGTLRSPLIAVPEGMDTLSLLFWTRFFGDGYSLGPHGDIELSADDGVTWTRIGMVAGVAPVYYPERADIIGYGGRRIRVAFAGSFATAGSWWLDEIQLLGHGSAPPAPEVLASTPLVSENPVRGASVRFAWPYGSSSGEIAIYDFAGRRVWHADVAADGSVAPWDVAAAGVPNGVYLVTARGAGQATTLRLFVARR